MWQLSGARLNLRPVSNPGNRQQLRPWPVRPDLCDSLHQRRRVCRNRPHDRCGVWAHCGREGL